MKNRLTNTSYEVLYILYLVVKSKILNNKEVCEFLGIFPSQFDEIIKYMTTKLLLKEESGNLLITERGEKLIKAFDLVNFEVENDALEKLNMDRMRKRGKKVFKLEDFYLPKDFTDDIRKEGGGLENS